MKSFNVKLKKRNRSGFRGSGLKKMNIEHRTSNIEHRMTKNEERGSRSGFRVQGFFERV